MIGVRGSILLATLTIALGSGCGQAPDGAAEAARPSELSHPDEVQTGLGSRSRPGAHHALDEPTAACAPKNVAFTPRTWVPPGPTRMPACTLAQVRSVAGCVWASGTTVSPACAAFWEAAENETCLKCAYTSAGDPVHGPLFDDGSGYASNNYPACVAAASNDRSANSCGARFEALIDCWWNACGHCDEDGSYSPCTEAADEGMCKPYRDGWTCAGAYENACFGANAAEDAVKIISLLCAP